MRKIFYLITKLITNDSDIDKAFMAKIKNHVTRDSIFKTI